MKTNNVVNAAFIGCGRISQKHFEAIKALNHKGAKLHAVADLDTAKCEAYRNDESMQITNDYQSSGFLDEIDLGVILTESGNHFKHAKYVLESGIDVLIEKPITLKLEDAYELKDIASKNDCKVYVVKQNRFNEPILEAKEFIKNGFLGQEQISSVQVRWCRPQAYYDLADWRGTWAMDGGVISNQASHHVDLMRWFMGPVKSVQALERRFGVDIETEDTVLALIEFESGAVGTIEATTSTRPRNLEGSFSIQGSKGAFEVGGFAVNEMRYMESNSSDFNDDLISKKDLLLRDTSDVYGFGHEAIYKEIIKDRHGLKNNSVSVSDAIKSLELIHMIYRSIETGNKVFGSERELKSQRMGN